MTHSTSNLIEQRLITAMRKAEGPYRRALAVIQSNLPQDNASAEKISECLIRLEPIMQQTQEIENVLAPLRQEWLALSRRPGEELKLVLNLHEQLLGTLIGRINGLEARMQQHRQAAIPSVDAHVKHQKMQRAYQSSR